MGARVIDRQNRTGTVIEAKKSDCRVKLDDGSTRYYLAWMLSAADGKKAQGTAAPEVAAGAYICYAAGGAAGMMRLTIQGARYTVGNGSAGSFDFDPKSAAIRFKSGTWEGYYGKVLGPGRIGVSSRPGGFYATTCDRK